MKAQAVKRLVAQTLDEMERQQAELSLAISDLMQAELDGDLEEVITLDLAEDTLMVIEEFAGLVFNEPRGDDEPF